MGCVLAGCLCLISTRLCLLGVWFFSDWFNRAFDRPWSWLAPLLGLCFAPVTVLYCSAVHNWWGGHWGPFQILGLLVCILIDAGGAGSQAKRRSATEE